MSEDARFEDGADRPLRLQAQDDADLSVVSALVQDAVVPVSEVRWQPSRRKFAMLINRFRWEDKARAERGGRPLERVRSMLVVEDASRVQASGVPKDADTVLSVLSLGFEPGEDGAGRLEITLAGDGAFALSVECLNITLTDVTRPYAAPSRKAPQHDP